jgi:hypothetical protein
VIRAGGGLLTSLALALLAGCGSPPAADEATPGLAPSTPSGDVASWAWDELSSPEEACSAVFTPLNESLRGPLAGAVSRWNAATGCLASVGERGLPVALVPEVVNDEGKPSNGVTDVELEDGAWVACTAVFISAQADDLSDTVLHELGHCLGAGRHNESRTGLMAARPGAAPRIDSESLALVCEALPCSSFTPEE